MKIAIVHNLPGGGAVRMLEQIIERYKKVNQIDLYCVGTTNILNIEGTKNNFYKVKPWKGFLLYNLWIIFILPLIHRQIAKSIDWSKYDLIFFTHDYFTKSPYLLRYINHSNKVYLCQESQREFYEPSKYHTQNVKEEVAKILRYPIKWIDVRNVKGASRLLCNSLYSKKILYKIYQREPTVVYPGVDEKYFCPKKIKKQDLIICIGGINKTKNQEFLINSLHSLLGKYKLVLVGSGSKKYINRIIGDNEHIEVLTKITDSNLRNLYRKSKLTCVTAYKEPFGLSSIESQSCGTPVLTVDGGGTVETIVNGKTGYISKMNEVEFLNKAIMILNRTDMGSAARTNVISNWTMEKTLKSLDKFFLL
jgi:glycosyltransferase involved in cell wall biosynthesis